MAKITIEQIGELIEQSKGRNPRVTRENLQAYLRNPDIVLQRKKYPVVVDYGKSVEEMVLAGSYDWKHDDINSVNFPLSSEGKTEVNVNLELVHLDNIASTVDVTSYFDENWLRPATVEELLAFGATYPDVQMEFPITCFGSSWVNSKGDRDVPCLYRNDSKRYLNLLWLGDSWGGEYRFLAVRCYVRVKTNLQTEMTTGGRTYKIIKYYTKSETQKVADNVTEEDGEHILKHQDEIPTNLRSKVVFVFPNCRDSKRPGLVYCIYWYRDKWVQQYHWLARLNMKARKHILLRCE